MKDKEKQYISMKETLTKRSIESITNCNCRKDKDGAFVDLLNQEMEELQNSMKEQEKQIEEMAIENLKCGNCVHLPLCLAQKGGVNLGLASENDCCYYQPKISEDSVVLTREEYDELINLQRTHAEDLTNAIQSYEESKADLKLEYDNHIKNLEKTIDRQSKDLNSQANRLIDLKAELENKGKETAEKFLNMLYWKAVKHIKGKNKNECFIEISFEKLDELAKQFGVEIKE